MAKSEKNKWYKVWKMEKTATLRKEGLTFVGAVSNLLQEVLLLNDMFLAQILPHHLGHPVLEETRRVNTHISTLIALQLFQTTIKHCVLSWLCISSV